MSREREGIKAEIMEQVEQMLEQALVAGEQRLTVTEIEELALGARQKMGQGLRQALLGQQVKQPAERPVCAGCGKCMSAKGKKKRYLRTRSGEVTMERSYFYCATCKRGLFPLG